MPLTIRLIRHGESQANTGEVRSWEVGDHNVVLTERGTRQAAQAGTRLGGAFLRGALVCLSPYTRAHQTWAGIARGAGLDPSTCPVREDPRLREVEHGYEDVPSQRALQDVHGNFYYRFKGGESPADCFDRTSGFLESLMREVGRSGIEDVVIVTHGLTIRCFVMRFLHLTVAQFGLMRNPGNCDVVTLGSDLSGPDVTFSHSGWQVAGLRLIDAPAS